MKKCGMKNICGIITLLLIPIILLSGCKREKYKTSEIIGFTSRQIEEKYGKFDIVGGMPNGSGLYCKCSCSYVVSKPKKQWYGTDPEVRFTIYFNIFGTAEECYYEEFGD